MNRKKQRRMKKSRRRRLEEQHRDLVVRLGEFQLSIPPGEGGVVDAPAAQLQHQIDAVERLLRKCEEAPVDS